MHITFAYIRVFLYGSGGSSGAVLGSWMRLSLLKHARGALFMFQPFGVYSRSVAQGNKPDSETALGDQRAELGTLATAQRFDLAFSRLGPSTTAKLCHRS